ncbi:MAG: hypothetical protein LBS36_11270 [Oscillospiraceae bacterium]|jgi:hypothetical protein|nr:hypothetical protein [Oscillospiraceae bacterium]
MPSQSEQILELIAITGELPAAALRRLCIKESYRYKLMANLQNKKWIKSFVRDGLKGYRLTATAKQRLVTNNPRRFSFFLTGNAETNKLHTEITRRLRLHHTAEATVTLMNAGIKVFPDEKPPLFSRTPAAVSKPAEVVFYYSREMKNIGQEHLKIRSSRASGVLFTDTDILLVYNTGKNLMKWEYQTELRCKALMNTRFCRDSATTIYTDGRTNGLMLGTDMDMAPLLLTSSGGYRRQYFRLDGTFDRFYFVPNTPDGETQLKILCSASVTNDLRKLLLSDLQAKDNGLRIEHDALTRNGTPVLLAFDFDMERIRRFHDSLEMFGQNGLIYCFDFQKPALETYLGTLAGFQTIDMGKVVKRFFT